MSRTPESLTPRLAIADRILLATRVWYSYLHVQREIRRKPLPELVRDTGKFRADAVRHSPALLSRAVDRSLNIGPHRARCLVGALVLYRLLREQGDEPELVIGLPDDARDHEAHAWVELGGVAVGPPPGRGRHVAMARFS